MLFSQEYKWYSQASLTVGGHVFADLWNDVNVLLWQDNGCVSLWWDWDYISSGSHSPHHRKTWATSPGYWRSYQGKLQPFFIKNVK